VKHFARIPMAGAPEKLDIAPVLEAIQLSPSSFGITPFQVHCVSKEATPGLLEKISKECFDNAEKINDCEHLLAFAARTDAPQTLQEFYTACGTDMGDKWNPGYEKLISGFLGGLDEEAFFQWAAQQANISLGFGLAAAADLNIASCPMAGFDPVGVHKALGLPDNQRMVVLLALGHESDKEEEFPKWRFPLDRVCKQYTQDV
jgi:nitroreductase / dihydropteridine reductase